MTTTVGQAEGTYDSESKSLTMIMTSTNAEGKQEKAKSVTKYEGRDTRAFTMYMQDPSGGDKWVKSMEITYKRRANAGKKRADR